MPIPKNKRSEKQEENTLKGTALSVGFVAAVIVIMWLAVFWIYMIRV